MSGGRGYESPTPSQWMGVQAITPSLSRAGSLTPERTARTYASLSAQALASPGRVGRDSVTAGTVDEDEAAMHRDLQLRMLENEGPPPSMLSEEEERQGALTSAPSSTVREASTLSSALDVSTSDIIVDHDMIDAQVDGKEKEEVEEEVSQIPAPAAAPAEPQQFVMHLFKEETEKIVLSPRHHLKYVDRKAEEAKPAAPAIDVAAVLASGDAAALASALQRVAVERTALENALRIEKSVTKLLETQARTLQSDTEAAKAALAREVARAAAEETVVMHEGEQPILCGADGLPLVLAMDGFAPPPAEEAVASNTATAAAAAAQPSPVAAIAVVTADAIMQTDVIPVTPKKQMADACAATSPSLRSPVAAASPRISRALLQTHALAPLQRSALEAKRASVDIRSLLCDYAAELSLDASRLVESVRTAVSLASAAAPPAAALPAAAVTPSGSGGEVDPADSSAAMEWMQRYQAEKKQRMKLHNTLLEMQGNIRVFARVRPHAGTAAQADADASTAAAAAPGAHAAAATSPAALLSPENDNLTRLIDDQTLGLNGKLFEFDKVLGPNSTQADVYSHVSPFIQSVADGFSVALFAYGQTGAGKTHTMDGCEGDEGVNTRALSHLFELLAASSARRGVGTFTSRVRLSALEVYNEQLKDLLIEPALYRRQIAASWSTSAGAPAPTEVTPRPLEIMHSAGPDGSVHIPGLTSREVGSVADIKHLINTYVRVNRSTAATAMNEYSSRSHLCLFVHVDTASTNPANGEVERTQGKLVLIDLAGSERVKRSEAQGQALKEAAHINKSLSALGDVMSALRSKSPHIPYRNSALTHLLSGSLSGQSRSKVIMMACTSSDPADAGESIGTLQFASRVRNVQLGVAKANKKKSQNAALIAKLAKVEQELAQAQGTSERLAAEAKAARDEVALERAAAQARIAAAQASVDQRLAALEAEHALKAKMFAIPLDRGMSMSVAAASMTSSGSMSMASIPIAHAGMAGAGSSAAAAAAASAANAAAAAEQENKQLQALLKAKEREILELKMQRNNPAMAIGHTNNNNTAAAAAAAGASSAMSPIARGLPQIHAFLGAAASPPARVVQCGVNLLEVPAPSPIAIAEGGVSAIPCSFDEALEGHMNDGSAAAAAAADVTAEIAPSKTKRDSLTGKKRKDSPSKHATSTTATTDEDEQAHATHAAADENATQPQGAMASSAAVPKSALSKKARTVAPLSSLLPGTPARSVLGHNTGAVNRGPSRSVAGGKSIVSLFSTGNSISVVKTPIRSAINVPTRPKWGTSAKVAPAASTAAPTTPQRERGTLAQVAAAANAAAADDIMGDDPNRTPIPSASGGKSVRFGAATTKFISPEPTPIAPSTLAAAAAAGLAIPSAITTPANIETLRVKTRAPTASKVGSALGSARRTLVKQAGWKTY